MKALHIIAFILIVVGGLNWLLFAFGWNLVSVIFGAGTTLAMIVYILIGLAAILEAVTHGSRCKTCGSSSAGMPMAK
jgi:uncharacterized membrane protein YuzA (DUF378 family)